MMSTMPGIAGYLAAVKSIEAEDLKISPPRQQRIEKEPGCDFRFATWLDLLVVACPGPLTKALGGKFLLMKVAQASDASERRI